MVLAPPAMTGSTLRTPSAKLVQSRWMENVRMLLGLHSTKLLLCQTASHGPRSFVQEQKGNACRREKDSLRLRQP